MNILVLIFSAKSGGHMVSTFSIMKELKKRGHNISWVSDYGDLVYELVKVGFKYYRLPYYYKSPLFLRNIIQLMNIIRDDDIDIIFSQEIIASTAILANIIKILTKKPLITTIAGGELSCESTYTFADTIIVFSEELKRSLCKTKALSEKRVTVIPNRINCEVFNEFKSMDFFKKKHGFKTDQKIILLISTLRPDKFPPIINLLSIIIDLYARHENMRFIIIGSGEKYTELEKKAKKINDILGKNIIILKGLIKNNVIPEYISMSNVVIAMGRSALESMAMSKPVLLLGYKGVVGLLNDKDIDMANISFYNFSGRNSGVLQNEKILEIFSLLLDNQPYALELGKKSREYVLENYNIGDVIHFYEYIIQRIVNKNERVSILDVRKFMVKEIINIFRVTQRKMKNTLHTKKF